MPRETDVGVLAHWSMVRRSATSVVAGGVSVPGSPGWYGTRASLVPAIWRIESGSLTVHPGSGTARTIATFANSPGRLHESRYPSRPPLEKPTRSIGGGRRGRQR